MNFSMSEIILVLIVAMLVLGPEKIPEFARKFGRFVRHFRKITDSVTSDFRKAIALDEEEEENKKATAGVREMADDLKKDIQDIMGSLDKQASKAKDALSSESRAVGETLEITTKDAREELSEGVKNISETVDGSARDLNEALTASAAQIGERPDASTPPVKTATADSAQPEAVPVPDDRVRASSE